MPELLTSKEAMAKLRVSPKTFYLLIKNGTIPARKIGKEWRISTTSLEQIFHGKAGEVVVDGGEAEGQRQTA